MIAKLIKITIITMLFVSLQATGDKKNPVKDINIYIPCNSKQNPVKALKQLDSSFKDLSEEHIKECHESINPKIKTYSIILSSEYNECKTSFTMDFRTRSGNFFEVIMSNEVADNLEKCLSGRKNGAEIKTESSNHVEDYNEDNDSDNLRSNEFFDENEESNNEKTSDIDEDEHRIFLSKPVSKKVCDRREHADAVAVLRKIYENSEASVKKSECYEGNGLRADYTGKALKARIGGLDCVVGFSVKIINKSNGKIKNEIKFDQSHIDECNLRRINNQEEKAALKKENKKNKKKAYLKRKKQRLAAEKAANSQNEENNDSDDLHLDENIDDEEHVDLNEEEPSEDRVFSDSKPESMKKCDGKERADAVAALRKIYKESKTSVNNVECYEGNGFSVGYTGKALQAKIGGLDCVVGFSVKIINKSNGKIKNEIKFDESHIQECDLRRKNNQEEKAALKKEKKKDKKKAYLKRKKQNLAAEKAANSQNEENSNEESEEVSDEQPQQDHKRGFAFTGGYSEAAWEDIASLYKDLVVADLFEGKIIYHQNVVKAEKQLVNGLNYSVVFSFNGKRCQLQVYSSFNKQFTIYHDDAESVEAQNNLFKKPLNEFKYDNCFDLYGNTELKKMIQQTL